jgi:hypothetical protein
LARAWLAVTADSFCARSHDSLREGVSVLSEPERRARCGAPFGDSFRHGRNVRDLDLAHGSSAAYSR